MGRSDEEIESIQGSILLAIASALVCVLFLRVPTKKLRSSSHRVRSAVQASRTSTASPPRPIAMSARRSDVPKGLPAECYNGRLVGTLVTINGLKSRPDLNGQFATVVAINRPNPKRDSIGMYVKLNLSGEVLPVPYDNLIAVDNRTPLEQAAARVRFLEERKGARVMIKGLKSRPGLNGHHATLVGPGENGRVVVKIFQKEVALRPENLDFRVKPASAVRRAKDDYREAKTRTGAASAVCDQCGEKPGDGGAGGANALMACGQCHAAWYCSKECQTKAWGGGHKKICPTLRAKKAFQNQPLTTRMHLNSMKEIPRGVIALPTSITGYAKEVPMILPVWMLEHESYRAKREPTASFRRDVEKSLRYFFKTERMGGARFTTEDIGNACTDALVALQIGVEGVRRVPLAEYYAADDRSWAIRLQTQCDVPRGWELDPKLKEGVPSRITDQWEEGIEQCRTRYGECDPDDD